MLISDKARTVTGKPTFLFKGTSRFNGDPSETRLISLAIRNGTVNMLRGNPPKPIRNPFPTIGSRRSTFSSSSLVPSSSWSCSSTASSSSSSCLGTDAYPSSIFDEEASRMSIEASRMSIETSCLEDAVKHLESTVNLLGSAGTESSSALLLHRPTNFHHSPSSPPSHSFSTSPFKTIRSSSPPSISLTSLLPQKKMSTTTTTTRRKKRAVIDDEEEEEEEQDSSSSSSGGTKKRCIPKGDSDEEEGEEGEEAGGGDEGKDDESIQEAQEEEEEEEENGEEGEEQEEEDEEMGEDEEMDSSQEEMEDEEKENDARSHFQETSAGDSGDADEMCGDCYDVKAAFYFDVCGHGSYCRKCMGERERKAKPMHFKCHTCEKRCYSATCPKKKKVKPVEICINCKTAPVTHYYNGCPHGVFCDKCAGANAYKKILKTKHQGVEGAFICHVEDCETPTSSEIVSGRGGDGDDDDDDGGEEEDEEEED